MKKLSFLVFILVAVFMIPFIANAEGKETKSDTSKEVNLYFFRGEGCSHCAEAEEWFKEIEKEYGSFFEVKDYETWYNEDNQALMEKVAEKRGETVEGVPYIIIGNKSWNGFADSYKEEMLAEIQTEFKKDVADRYDIMNFLDNNTKEEKSSSSDAIALLIILIVAGGVGFGIYQARKNTN